MYTQRKHEHTRTGNWSESGFGSLGRAPLNISSCLGGGGAMPRPYGRVCSHLQCDRLSLGLTLKNRRVNCTFTGKPIIRPTANCSAFDVSTLTRHFVFTLYCSHQTVPCSVLRRVDPKSPLHIHSTLFTPVVRPTVPCSELRRSEDWPSQHIRVVVGRCIRTNTIICKQPPCPFF